MGRAASISKWAAGGTGGLIVAAAQTKPEDAVSNLSGWAKILGSDTLAVVLSAPNADLWATGVGISLLLSAIVLLVVDRKGTAASTSVDRNDNYNQTHSGSGNNEINF
jgi:hypothetical protein